MKYSQLWKVQTPCDRQYQFLFDPISKEIRWLNENVPEYQKEQHEQKFKNNLQ